MRILLTNDDGITSPGLAVLRRVLEPLGDVTTIAPSMNNSAVARSITIDRSLRVEPVVFGAGYAGWAVDGTPCDCVRIALLGQLALPPQAVVAGINLGANTGDDVTYSGTVGAAFEGALHDLPAIAVSVASKDPGSLIEPTELIRAIVARALSEALPARTVLNVNLPDRPLADIAGVRVTGLGGASCSDRLEMSGNHSRGREWRVYCEPPAGEPPLGSDSAALAAGFVAVTPLRYDLVDPHAVAALEAWHLDDVLAPQAGGAAGR
jgi:5'-nucleotidase